MYMWKIAFAVQLNTVYYAKISNQSNPKNESMVWYELEWKQRK